MDAWLALVGLSLGVMGALTSARRQMLRQEAALTIALTVAALEATRRAQGPVSPAHFAHAAVFALERDGGPDLSLVRETLEAHLDALPTAHVPPEAPLGREIMAAMNAAANAAGRRSSPLSLRDVLERLRSHRHVAALLDAAERPPISRPGDRVGAPYRAPAASDVARLLLLNDDTSTMEGVLVVLRDTFAKGSAEALHLMLTTHYEGHAVVGRCPRSEAEVLCRRATLRARELGMPLAIVIDTEGDATTSKRPTLTDRVLGLFRATPDPSR